MRNLLSEFPRHFATPRRRLVKTETDFYDLVNRYNGKTSIYFSVYGVDVNGKFENANIDKIAWDFDGELALDHCRKLAAYCLQEDLKFSIYFSGMKGFHLYILSTNYEDLKSPKESLYNAHKHFEKTVGVENDQHIVGDVARIMRIPNSYHVKGKRYCIPLTLKELNKPLDEIKKLASKQQPRILWYGSKLLDMKQFDFANPSAKKFYEDVELKDYNYVVELDDKIVDRFHPCVKQWLYDAKNNTEGCNYEQRYLFAVYCAGRGYPPSLTDSLAKEYFGKKKVKSGHRNAYEHFKAVSVLRYAYAKDNVVPNCATLIKKGFCKGRCKHYTENNFPLYIK